MKLACGSLKNGVKVEMIADEPSTGNNNSTDTTEEVEPIGDINSAESLPDSSTEEVEDIKDAVLDAHGISDDSSIDTNPETPNPTPTTPPLTLNRIIVNIRSQLFELPELCGTEKCKAKTIRPCNNSICDGVSCSEHSIIICILCSTKTPFFCMVGTFLYTIWPLNYLFQTPSFISF